VLTIQETLQGQAPRTETRTYDRFDRLEHAQNVYGKTVDYTYDAVGNRTTLLDSEGKQTTWAYDGLNRKIRIDRGAAINDRPCCFPYRFNVASRALPSASMPAMFQRSVCGNTASAGWRTQARCTV
jgi:YD repeat-containing protein